MRDHCRFVPTLEIAKLMYKFKNSILKYNPRSYLDLSNNPVNFQIAQSVRNRVSKMNLLCLTMELPYDLMKTKLTEETCQKNRAQLKLTNPQVINGGQTAYTLSKIYEDELSGGNPDRCFQGKEVLVKVITFLNDDDSECDPSNTLQLIEAISKATNLQTGVTDADRRSNDSIQIQIQDRIFSEFGNFYERKRGEYWNGTKDGYIEHSQIVGREVFLRVSLASAMA